MRAWVSMLPPGGNGTMKRTGLDGKAASALCAYTGVAAAALTHAIRIAVTAKRGFMWTLSEVVLCKKQKPCPSATCALTLRHAPRLIGIREEPMFSNTK